MSTGEQPFWDDEAATFDDEPDHGLLDPEVRHAWQRLLAPLLPPPPAAAVDLGCGTGTLSVLLAEHGLTVTGLDLSAPMIEQARSKAARLGLGIDFRLGDAADPPLEDDAFDVAICRHVLWTMSDPSAVVRRWRGLLRPGGIVLVIEGAWSTGGGLTAAQTMDIVSPHFACADVVVLDDPTLWGRTISDERYLIVARTGASGRGT